MELVRGSSPVRNLSAHAVRTDMEHLPCHAGQRACVQSVVRPAPPGTVKNLYTRCKIGLQALCCLWIYGIVAAFCFSLRRMAGIDLSTVALVGPEIGMPEKCLCTCSSEISHGGPCVNRFPECDCWASLNGKHLIANVLKIDSAHPFLCSLGLAGLPWVQVEVWSAGGHSPGAIT